MIRHFIISILLLFLFLFNSNSIACFKRTAHLNNYAKSGDDITIVLQKLVDKYDNIVIDEGVWYLSAGIRLRNNVIIRGVDPRKSIIKRSANMPLWGGMLFYTEQANPDIYTKRDERNEFSRLNLHYHNIHFSSITIDFNRNPDDYSDKLLKSKNLYGIAFIKASNCSVNNCLFIDQMTRAKNNGYPAIVVLQSESIRISRNSSERISFLQIIYSNNVFVSDNNCNNSVGTAIETIGGYEHKIYRNIVKSVYWNVSCVGINSLKCNFMDNEVYMSDNNISCLTLGHEGTQTAASQSIVHNNRFYSEGTRCILIQNGANISVNNNTCSCRIEPSSSVLTSGCIVASGDSDGIYGLDIKGNNLISLGDGCCGCITYRGTGTLTIEKNHIKSNRGITILSNNNTSIIIKENNIQSINYSIEANCHRIVIDNNTMTDGIITNVSEIVIKNNSITHLSNHSYLGKKWTKVVIDNNSLKNSTSFTMPYAFILDASEKGVDFDEKMIAVFNNTVVEGSITKIVNIAGTYNCPQLKNVE